MRSVSQAEIEETPDPPEYPRAVAVHINAPHFFLVLDDGRVLAVPLEWSVKLRDAPIDKLANVVLLGDGEDISWPDLNEDMHIFDLLYPRRFADQLR